ncbi:MAG: hypothetical protein ACKPKO_04585, partial [Candidatus Fonsibacter sp.]
MAKREHVRYRVAILVYLALSRGTTLLLTTNSVGQAGRARVFEAARHSFHRLRVGLTQRIEANKRGTIAELADGGKEAPVWVGFGIPPIREFPQPAGELSLPLLAYRGLG